MSILKPVDCRDTVSTSQNQSLNSFDDLDVSSNVDNYYRRISVTAYDDDEGIDIIIPEQFSADELISDSLLCDNWVLNSAAFSDDENENLFMSDYEDSSELKCLQTIEAFSGLSLNEETDTG